jgi:protein SCO1/2
MRSFAALGMTVAFLTFGAVACKPTEAKPFNPEGLSGPQPTPPIPKPDFVLTDTDGKPFDFRKETEGKVALLFFGYTSCPDVCPVHLANIAQALSRLGPEVNEAVEVVFVTTDPARDSAAAIRKWLDHFDRRFVGLRGDTTQIVAAMKQMPVLGPILVQPTDSGGYGIGHSTLVIAFTRDNLAHVFYPFGIRQADWAKDLQILAAR